MGKHPAEPAERRAPAAAPWPRRVGNYDLLALLGKGGMGAVFQARHVNLNHLVAIKLLPPASLHKPGAVERFYREMAAVGAIRHENVIRATDAGEAAGFHYLVMEYVEGADLKTVVQNIGNPDPATAADIVQQACAGLSGIRAAGLIHRDVKPSNLFLTSTGTVKLLDLGLARFLTAEEDGRQITLTDHALGTPDFIAPEQAENSREVDIRTDIYSMGCTLYALLSGRPPFASPEFDSWPKKLIAHCREPAPPLPAEPAIPLGLAEVTQRCLEKDPAQRFQTPEELIAALAPYSRGASTIAYAQQYAAALESQQSLFADTVDTTSFTSRSGVTRSMEASPNQGESAAPARRVAPWAWAWAAGAVGVVLAAVMIAGGVFGIGSDAAQHDAAQHDDGAPSAEAPPEGAPADDAPPDDAEVPADLPQPMASDGAYDLPLLDKDRRPTKAQAQADRYDAIPVHRWQRLLEHCPCRGIMVDPEGLASVSFREELQQISVHGGEYTLLQLGSIAVDDYEIQVGIHESNWGSGSGLFFGLRRNGEDAWDFQFVRFSTANMDDAGFGSRLIRGRGTVKDNDQGGFVVGLQDQMSQEVPHVLSGEQMLRLTIAGGAMKEISVDSSSLHDLKKTNDRFTAEDYHGGFGTFNYSSTSVFRNGQLKRLAPRD